jgi:hypothetical protein
VISSASRCHIRIQFLYEFLLAHFSKIFMRIIPNREAVIGWTQQGIYAATNFFKIYYIILLQTFLWPLSP